MTGKALISGQLRNMDNAVVTFNTPQFESHVQYSHPSFKAYAKKTGSDFIALKERKFPDRDCCYEKFQIRDIINSGYKRILYIDSDVFIKPSCENLFSLVPEEMVGGVYDCRDNIQSNEDRVTQVKNIQYPHSF